MTPEGWLKAAPSRLPCLPKYPGVQPDLLSIACTSMAGWAFSSCFFTTTWLLAPTIVLNVGLILILILILIIFILRVIISIILTLMIMIIIAVVLFILTCC